MTNKQLPSQILPLTHASLFQRSHHHPSFTTPRVFTGGKQDLSYIAEMSATAISDISLNLNKRLLQLRNPPSPASLPLSTVNIKSVEESLFDASASAKISISQVAMHMPKSWREKLFRQIDSLHDIAGWDNEDKPIRKASFATFLKAILQIKPKRHPGLGLSYEGYVIASWVHGQDRLITEYLPNDRVRWILTRHIDGEIERASGQTIVSRLIECLGAYQPEYWFSNEKA